MNKRITKMIMHEATAQFAPPLINKKARQLRRAYTRATKPQQAVFRKIMQTGVHSAKAPLSTSNAKSSAKAQPVEAASSTTARSSKP